MNKRDVIQKCIMRVEGDEVGGSPAEKEPKEFITAYVSLGSTGYEETSSKMAEYGIKSQWVLKVVTSNALEESKEVRYIWKDRLFRVMHQVKVGNEYFSILVEQNE